MTTYLVKGTKKIAGNIALPTSKSISNRLLMMSVLCGSKAVADNLSESDDTRVMIEALQGDKKLVDVGAAGTSMRFLTAYLATLPGTHEITGSDRMKKRPIALLVDALRQLGAKIDYVGEEGFPPLRITGGSIKGGHLTLPGGVSSQYISALMMIGPTLRGGLTISLEGNVISTPYIEMTKAVMEAFGAHVSWESNVISVAERKYIYSQKSVEGDWSAASYWYAMAALMPGTKVKLLGLHRDSLQGDSAVARIAAPLGVSTTFEPDGALISSSDVHLNEYEYNFICQPDLAQTFVVLCCLMGVHFRFTGLQSLRIKETDRMAALENELRKIGFVIQSNGVDTLSWDGTTCPPSHEPIATYKDHRMAMAFAPSALTLGEVLIAEPEVVSKSYPKFWDDLRSVGFSIEVQQ